jgi:hypothetical protein
MNELKTNLIETLVALESDLGVGRVTVRQLANACGNGTVASVEEALKSLRRDRLIRLVAIGCCEGWDLENDCLPGVELRGVVQEWFGVVETR